MDSENVWREKRRGEWVGRMGEGQRVTSTE